MLLSLNSAKQPSLSAFCAENFVILAEKQNTKVKMNRKYTFQLTVMALAALTGLTTISCKRDLYDEEVYKDMAKKLSPVDSIEAGHDFKTTATYEVAVKTTAEPDTRKVQILSGNPVAGETCYILASKDVTTDGPVRLAFSTPIALKQLYAALVNSSGKYTIARFTPGRYEISTSPAIAQQVQLSQKPSPQIYTYCFESEQPEVGNYDYNDLVLRISQERIDSVRLLLNITLAAVGTNEKLAAAIRLVGYNINDIDSVKTEGLTVGETFDDNYELYGASSAFENIDLLQTGLHDEAVIKLFEDAHWATGASDLLQQNMSLLRLRYNVSKFPGEEYDLVSPRTITYTIKFKSAAALDGFTIDCLDPFIIKQMNSGFGEIHLGEFQGAQILYEYVMVDAARLLPWALLIPNGTFRYPLQGYNMGYRKDGYLFGTYMTTGHAFGEWVEDHTKAIDWYNYPTLNMAF